MFNMYVDREREEVGLVEPKQISVQYGPLYVNEIPQFSEKFPVDRIGAEHLMFRYHMQILFRLSFTINQWNVLWIQEHL